MQYIIALEEAFPNHIINDGTYWSFSEITKQIIFARNNEITFVKKNTYNTQFFKYVLALEATKGRKWHDDIDIMIIINVNNYILYYNKYVKSMGTSLFIKDVIKYIL